MFYVFVFSERRRSFQMLLSADITDDAKPIRHHCALICITVRDRHGTRIRPDPRTSDPRLTRPDLMQIQCVTLQTTFLQ